MERQMRKNTRCFVWNASLIKFMSKKDVGRLIARSMLRVRSHDRSMFKSDLVINVAMRKRCDT